jgi:DNA polymerase-3 subunit alpha
MAAVMSRNISNITEITKFMDECKAIGISVLGPDVNESNLKFTVNAEGNIRFGLGAIKGVGESTVQSITEERKTNGLFRGIFDFVQRVNLNTCNKKNMECLALAGAFDGFSELKREQYFAVNSKNEIFLEILIRYGNRYQTDKAVATHSLFGGENIVDIATPEIPVTEQWNDLERLNREKELVGIYLSAHPLDEYAIVLNYICNTQMTELNDTSALTGKEIIMGGIVAKVRKGTTKNGNPFGVVRIEDYSGSAELAFFGSDYVTFQGYLEEGLFLYINAHCQPKQWKPNELEIKVASIDLLSNVKEKLIEKITIFIPLMSLNAELITELSAITKQNPGETELYFKVTDTDEKVHVDFISRPVKVSVGKELIGYIDGNQELEFQIN